MKGMKPMWGRWGWAGLAVALMAALAGLGSGGRGLGALAQGGFNVEWVGQIGGATLAVAVQGRYAYVGVGPRLVVVDVGDPARPVEVGRTGVLPGVVQDVAVSGTYAYVADRDRGLRVIDVSDPSSPREVGFYDPLGYASGVAVSGSYAYVADGSGLRVIDVSNPSSPREVGFYNTPGWAEDVAVSGSYAYVADGDAGLRVIDVSNPSSPREVGFYDTPGRASGVAVSGAYAYVADREGGLVILRFLGAGATYSISGRVVDGSGNPISGVTVSDNAGHTTTTGSDGRYTLSGLAAGTYTLTPSKSGYTFSPPSRAVTVPPDATGVDFVGTTAKPAGALTLLFASTIPATQPVVATAQARNTGASRQEFTLAFRLRQGDVTLDTRAFALSLPPGGTAERTADFGLRPAGRYRIEATLSVGDAVLATQSGEVAVTDPHAARIILDYAGDLRDAAHAELDDIAYIPSHALADEILDFGLDKIEEYAVGKFADLAAPIQDAGGIPLSTSNDAIDQIRAQLGRARRYRQNLSATIRAFVRERYGMRLPDGFDPLNPDLSFITDPLLKERIRNALVGLLEDFFRDVIISPLWVNGPRGEVDLRHRAFEDFMASRVIVGEPPGLAVLMQHGRDRVRNVVEGDAIVTLGPYNVLGHTLRYDLTLQEQENKRQQLHRVGGFLQVAFVVLVIIGAVIILLQIVGAISSGGVLASVVAPTIYQIVNLLFSIKNILPLATAFLVISMVFTVPIIAPHVPQYQDETLDAAEALLGGSGSAGLRAFEVAVRPGRAELTARLEGPETGQSRVLVETALYSVDGRILHLVWAPLRIRAGQLATLSKEVPLAPGTYRAVTTLYTEGEVVTAPVVPFQVPGPEIAMSLWLEQPRLSPGQAVQAHVLLTNTSPISDVNDLTLILESTDGVHFDAWPVSLAAGATRRIDYTFTPTTTGAYVLRAWLGIGASMLAQQDAAYLVGSGPAIALNTSVSEVYPPGVTVTLPLTLTNVGDAPGTVTITLRTVDRLRLGAAVFTTTVTAEVPAGGIVVAEGIALPSASPGLYSVQMDLNGAPYDSRDFAVAALDTLFGLLTVGEMYPAVGQRVPVTVTVRGADNTLTDAAITVTVRTPAGGVMGLPMTRVASGVYRGDYTPAISGTHALELEVARANDRGVGDVSFLVAGSPTLLIPEVEGQPQAGEIRPVTVTVRSEAGAPIPGATVVLSGTQEILRGKTDAAGQVVFQTFPPDGRPYRLTVEKMGYAGATTEVAVGWLRLYLPLVLRNR